MCPLESSYKLLDIQKVFISNYIVTILESLFLVKKKKEKKKGYKKFMQLLTIFLVNSLFRLTIVHN